MEYARIMTRYLCAPDSFKESLTAMQAAEAMARGIENADRDAEIRCLPMADGGEGTVRALVDATGGTMHAVPVHDPLGRLIEGRFGVLADGATAVVETAEASGLARLNAEERNPLIASSYGTGELLLAAARLGVRRIIVGLGGSATNDAGAGLLQSLGVRLLDANGDELGRGGAALADVSVIDITTMDPAIGNVSIIAACDVTNPLTGPTGASAVFGPQKGAGADDVVTLDAALAHFARLIESRFGVDVSDVPGAGAAGGIGAALKGFFGAEFRSGVDIVIEQSGLDEAVQWLTWCSPGKAPLMLRPDSAKLLPVWPEWPNGMASPLSPWPDVLVWESTGYMDSASTRFSASRPALRASTACWPMRPPM